ncbi:hypothetical protein DL96DRAFT_31422 [Flagelloscypha sp. PMI_526]|nr:hypothetical protein DL96DRAFT_31422 [Flagelloscypha sp. PMI_526]
MLLARLNALENPGNNVPSPSQPNIRGKKRGRDSPSPTPPPALHRNSTVGAKRAKKGDSYIQDQARSLSPLLSIASTPDDFDTPPPVEAPSFPVVATTNTVSNVPQNSMQRRFKPLDCGLCSVNTPCACRELGLRDDEDNSMSFSRTVLPPINIESPDQKPLPSILDNLPPFQPAVPLRRRGAGRSSGTNSLFPVVAPEPSNSSDPAPNCSGDPKNCPACAGDTFGQAFCAELSVKTRCDDCPGEDTCSSRHGESSATVVPPSAVSEAVPTNEAWRQLKSHPNIAFADLSMLADVVARRSKCTGAVVRLSPHPDETDPGSRHNTPASTVKATEDDTKPVLVPQEVLTALWWSTTD